LSPTEIAIDNENNVCFSGRIRGNADLDPGPGVDSVFTGSLLFSVFHVKLDSSGNYSSGGVVTGSGTVWINDIQFDKWGLLYLTGFFTGTADFDEGIGIDTLSTTGSGAYILKLNKNGNYVWASSVGEGAAASGIQVDHAGQIYHFGRIEGLNDLDPGSGVFSVIPSPGDENIFLEKLVQDTCNNLAIVIDSAVSLTCVMDGHAHAAAEGGVAPYSWAWSTTPPSLSASADFSSGGYYTVTLTDSIGCVTDRVVLIDEPSGMGFDLEASLITAPLIPGFSTCFSIDGWNNACTPQDGYLYVVLPPLFYYSSSSPAADSLIGDTLFWNFSSLTYDSTHVTASICGALDSSAVLGSSICFTVAIEPFSGDSNPANNRKVFCRNVVGSYDPNDKQAYPEGACDANYVTPAEPILYTVRFQNTGTAEALNVTVLDTLSPWLDINSVRVVANSHTMITELEQDSILRFRFSDIHLPDSLTDADASQGYFIFEVNQSAAIPPGTTITNSASIYFDANDPVISNQVLHTSVSVIPGVLRTEAVSVCFGSDLIFPDGTLLDSITTPLVHVSHLINYEGCDSIIHTTVSLLPKFDQTQTISVCPGASHLLPDGTLLDSITSSLSHISTLVTLDGCDSILTTNIVLAAIFSITDSINVCEGSDLLLPDGTLIENISGPGIFISNLSTTEGCDSIITTAMSVTAIDTSVVNTGSTLMANHPGLIYQWIDCTHGMTTVAGATAQSFIPDSTGEYAVILNQSGCSDTSACHLVLITANSLEHQPSDYSIFPNPSTDMITLVGNGKIISGIIEIISVNGQVLISGREQNAQEVKLDISQIPQGLYLVKITERKTVHFLRFVKD
jgi:uncharacterized repeat protein (TIGR01451 family)